MTRTSRAGNAGFTLLEVLVTLSICLLILGSVPLMLEPISDAHQFQRTRDQLINDLRMAGLEARRSGKIVTFSLASDASSYLIGDSLIQRELPEGIRIIAESESQRPKVYSAIHFYPSGQAEARRWVLTDDLRRSVIVVDRLIGHVLISD